MPSPTYDIRETPVASEVALAVFVEKSVMAENPSILPDEGALYGTIDAKLMPADLSSEWNNYRYLGNETGNATNLVLIFGKVRTQEERDTPYRTLTSFGDHRWPPILEALAFFKDAAFGRSTYGSKGGKSAIITGPSYFVRQVYQCEVNEGSRFISEEFFSDVPFDIPTYPVPIPRAVYYDVPGAHGGFQECIGPEIRIPNFQTANAAFVVGNQSAASGSVRGQYYPATDMEEWTSYILTDQQDFTSGYRRRRIRVIPPLVDDDDIVR